MRICWHFLVFVLLILGVTQQVFAQSGRSRTNAFQVLAKKYDANDDGKIDKQEYDRDAKTFARLDTNNDGTLSAEDWQGRHSNRHRGGRDRHGNGKAPRTGQVAPDFELTHVQDESKTIKLSDFAGKKPVALLFGSCT